jgi:dTMP kinase
LSGHAEAPSSEQRPASAGRRPGRFITFEGPDGSGKTSQAARLAAALEAEGRPVVSVREPGGTVLGEQLRDLLLRRADVVIEPLADALLFNAARAQLVAEVIGPALAAGNAVVCARFADSTLAYQGYGAGLDLDRLRALAAIATGGLTPDLTILLDLPAETGLVRKRRGRSSLTRFESEDDDAFDLAFHRRVRAGLLEMAAAEPRRWRVLDATRARTTVARDVLAAARALWEPGDGAA